MARRSRSSRPRGASIVGVSSPEGAVLAANDDYDSSLEDPNQLRNIFQLDEHVAAALAGHGSDARVLTDQARLICQRNRLLHDEKIDVESLTASVGDLPQVYMRYAWVRLFGVRMVIAGVDRRWCRVLAMDPTGGYRFYRAIAVGRKSD